MLFSSLIASGSLVTDNSWNHVSWQENKQVLPPLKRDLTQWKQTIWITCVLPYLSSILVTREDACLWSAISFQGILSVTGISTGNRGQIWSPNYSSPINYSLCISTFLTPPDCSMAVSSCMCFLHFLFKRIFFFFFPEDVALGLSGTWILSSFYLCLY